jgi:hypothetical protein
MGHPLLSGGIYSSQNTYWITGSAGRLEMEAAIQVGRDQIMGLDNLSILSAPLLNALKSRGLPFFTKPGTNPLWRLRSLTGKTLVNWD